MSHDTMSSSLLFSKISNYYHSGHFHDAREEILNALDNVENYKEEEEEKEKEIHCKIQPQQQQRHHHEDDKNHNKRFQRRSQNGVFLTLSKLALKADESLCQFRSLVGTNSSHSRSSSIMNTICSSSCSSHAARRTACGTVETEQEEVEALRDARRCNHEYMAALQDVVCSLYHHHHYVLKSSPAGSSSSSSSSFVQPETHCDHNIMISNDIYTWQTAMAIIMTSISASWLHLYWIQTDKDDDDDDDNHDDDDDDDETESAVQKRTACTAALLLQDGICLAACCLTLQNPNSCYMTWSEGLCILDMAGASIEAAAVAAAAAEGENVDDGSFMTNNSKLHAMQTVREQMCIALRQLHHSLKVVGLVTVVSRVDDIQSQEGNDDDGQKGSCEDESIPLKKKKKKNKQQKTTREEMLHDKIASSSLSSSLTIQEYLVEALYHHGKGREELKQKRNEYIQKAMDIEKGGVALKYKTLLEATDFLLDGKPVHNNGLLSDSFMGPLRALSKTNQSALCLLGCVYAKQRDWDEAMECFQRAWELRGNYEKTADLGCTVDERDIVWNIAECFGQKGRNDLLLESLLYWIHLKDELGGDCYDVEQHSVKPAVFGIYNNSRRVTNNYKNDQELMRLRVLYRIFFAASSVKDWDTCRVALEDLMALSVDDFLPMAKLHVMIQQENARAPLQLPLADDMQEWYDPLLWIGRQLYESEIILHHFLYPLENDEPSPQELSLSAVKKIEKVHSLWKCIKTHLPETTKRQIQSMIDNNLGIALVYNGRPLEAMPLFLNSSKASQEEDYHLCPLYNLSLLLWIQGFKKEACKLYLTKREYKDSFEKALQGQTKCLESDLKKCLIALEEYTKTNEHDKNTNGEKMCLLLDICMMKYMLQKKL
jgi:Tetratricopeptide repeat.